MIDMEVHASLYVRDSVNYGQLLVALLEQQSLTGLAAGPDGRLHLRMDPPCWRPGLMALQPPSLPLLLPPQPGRQPCGL
jgi:hypothetical protein